MSTVQALLAQGAKPDAQAATHRRKAGYHLQRALEYGWPQLEAYTLQDADFAALELGNRISSSQLRQWAQKGRQYLQRRMAFRARVQETIAGGDPVMALRMLYQSEFAATMRELIDRTEDAVIRQFWRERCIHVKRLQSMPADTAAQRQKAIDSALDLKIARLLGENGKRKWQWVRRGRK